MNKSSLGLLLFPLIFSFVLGANSDLPTSFKIDLHTSSLPFVYTNASICGKIEALDKYGVTMPNNSTISMYLENSKGETLDDTYRNTIGENGYYEFQGLGDDGVFLFDENPYSESFNRCAVIYKPGIYKIVVADVLLYDLKTKSQNIVIKDGRQLEKKIDPILNRMTRNQLESTLKKISEKIFNPQTATLRTDVNNSAFPLLMLLGYKIGHKIDKMP